MYRIAICDDDYMFLKLIEDKIQDYCKEHNIDVSVELFCDSSLLVEYLCDKKFYNAYILDIEMPEYSGLDISKKIQKDAEYAFIVFLTAYESYAVKGYGPNVLSYVLKERLEEDLEYALKLLFSQLERQREGKMYLINNQRKYVQINHEGIIYIYKEQKNAVFVLRNHKEERERATLKEVIEKLDNSNMYVLDRSIILNVKHIRKISDDRIELSEQHNILSSRSRIISLKEYLTWGK